MIIGHKLDPRTKLVMVLAISSMAVFITDISFLVGLTLFCLCLALFMGGNLRTSLQRARRMVWLIVPIAIIQSIFAPSGQALLAAGGMELLTIGGLLKGAAMGCRIAILIISASIMATSSSRDIVRGMVQWGMPYEIAFMVSVAIRFLPMLTDETRDALTALKLRGVDSHELSLRQRLKVYSYLLMPVVVSTVLKSQQLSMAMEARGFRAYSKRTYYRTLTLEHLDYALIFATLVITTTVFYVHYLG